MNYGPILFLAAFVAMAGSWFGLVLKPQVQLGVMQQTNSLGTPSLYPVARSGLAQQGLQVYRANGCNTCHSLQATQRGTTFEVALSDAGTNAAAVLGVLQALNPALGSAEAEKLLASLPKTVMRGDVKAQAEATLKAITTNGAKASLSVVPVGPDIMRGWGKRRSVAEDFLFDYPVMPGSQRVGPDLAHTGARLPDANWHLRHLYAPTAEVKGSTMPPYRFLFELRKVGRSPAADALALPGQFAPPPGYEVVPRPEATALVAYLLSLRTEVPLYSAPLK